MQTSEVFSSYLYGNPSVFSGGRSHLSLLVAFLQATVRLTGSLKCRYTEQQTIVTLSDGEGSYIFRSKDFSDHLRQDMLPAVK